MAVASQAKGWNPGHVLAQYPLDGSIPTCGLVFCKFVRQGNGWVMQALGWGCGGRMATDKECVNVCTGQVAPTAFEPGTHKLTRMKQGRVVANADTGCADCILF